MVEGRSGCGQTQGLGLDGSAFALNVRFVRSL